MKVTLSLDAAGYLSGLDKAAAKTKQATAEAEKLAAKSAGFEALGKSALVVGTAITGIGLAALAVGVNYNSLQQSSRKALGTLLGSASAAADQMDRLDEFAKTSPFAKQTFIKAQQQMLAFGIETKKVVPYLDAIQNAVAAAGGSNAELEGITTIMSKIQSSAKITAQDLNQMGNYGINAAELIGSAMGKTGAEIREEITAGTLDATVALDALADGMGTQFAGASAGLKETFEGAMDRMKAAWRDFGSALAEPLVGKEGGGMLVDMLNWAADMLRGFESLPGPVKVATTAVVGATGAVALLGGAALLAWPRLVVMAGHMSALGITAGIASLAVGGFVAAVALIAVGISGALSKIELTTVQIAKLDDAMRKVDSSKLDDLFMGAAESSRAGSRGMTGFKDALDGLTSSDFFKNKEANKVVGGFIDGMTGGIFNLSGDLKKFEAQFTHMGQELARVAETDFAAATDGFNEFVERAGGGEEAVKQLAKAFPDYEAKVIDLASSLGLATDEQSILNYMQGEGEGAAKILAAAQKEAAAATGDVTEKVRSQTDALSENTDAMMENSGSVLSALESALKYEQQVISATEKIKENNKVLDDSAASTADKTAAEQSNREELYKLTRAGMDQVKANRDGGASTRDLQRDVKTIRADFIKQAEATGLSTDAANRLADELNLIPGDYVASVKVEKEQAERNIQSFMDKWNHTTLTFYQNMVNTGAAPPKGHPAGFASGGYTGPGSKHQVAGLVHAGEYVSTMETTAKPENRAALEFMQRGGTVRGYAGGGLVAPPRFASAPSQSAAPVSVSLAGARFDMQIDGRTVTAVVREQAAVVVSEVGRSRARGFRG